MRVLFCGTPEFGIPTMRSLLADTRFQVTGVITQPDRRRGRGLESGESPVKRLAHQAGLEVFQPEKIRVPEAQQWIEGKTPDAVVLVAYGQILPARLLAIPRLGWINLHGSLLPRYRGAAPVAWAIANGEKRTGVTTMQIDAGMDTGSMLLARELAIGADEDAPALYSRMAEAGAPLVLETLDGLERGTLVPRPQENERATYAPLLKREDGRIAWESSAQQIYDRMRGFAPWPGAFAQFRGARVSLWGRPWTPAAEPLESAGAGTMRQAGGALLVACGPGGPGDGATWLEITEAQPEGRRRVTAREFAIGARLGASAGERFE